MSRRVFHRNPPSVQQVAVFATNASLQNVFARCVETADKNTQNGFKIRRSFGTLASDRSSGPSHRIVMYKANSRDKRRTGLLATCSPAALHLKRPQADPGYRTLVHLSRLVENTPRQMSTSLLVWIGMVLQCRFRTDVAICDKQPNINGSASRFFDEPVLNLKTCIHKPMAGNI